MTSEIFGYKLNMFIFSDSMSDYAAELYKFFDKYVDVECVIATSREEYKEHMRKAKKIDFLIIAGKPHDPYFFRSLTAIRKHHPETYFLLINAIEGDIEEYIKMHRLSDRLSSSLPLSEISAYINTMQYYRTYGFDFEEHFTGGELSLEKAVFSIKPNQKPLIKLSNFGIRPVGQHIFNDLSMCYKEIYEIKKSNLYLDKIIIEEDSGIFPPIKGIKPVYDKTRNGKIRYIYSGLSIKIPYSGMISVRSKAKPEITHIDFEFKDGKLEGNHNIKNNLYN